MTNLTRQTVLWIAALAAAGCTPTLPKGVSPLVNPRMSSDSVVLDVFFVRFPVGDDEANRVLWQEIDEQQVSAELRKRLSQNGFRVGVIGGQVPITLSKLLELKDKPVSTKGETKIEVADLGPSAPRVERRHMPLRRGVRGEILTSAVYEQLPVLFCGQGELCGQTYPQAQALFGIVSFPQGDGRVKIQLVPELQHDQVKQRWVGDQGMMRLESGRPRRTFESLEFSAMLAPGEMLVLTGLPARLGSLGYHFFTERDAGSEAVDQKLLILRLSQTQQNDLFAPSEPLKLEEPPLPPQRGAAL